MSGNDSHYLFDFYSQIARSLFSSVSRFIQMTDTNRDERSPLISHYERLSDTIDQRTVFQRKISVWLILLSAGLERLSFYSLAGNLVLFLTSKWIHWTSAHSLTTVFLFLGNNDCLEDRLNHLLCFIGISYVSALFFAWLSDNKVGRPKTIIFGRCHSDNRFDLIVFSRFYSVCYRLCAYHLDLR